MTAEELAQNTDYLSQLNDQQRAAVEYIDGPQLVIAGAGSGKTRVLAYKIVHLLHKGFEPWRLMALTFTNKAAREMKERITSLVGEQAASKIQMGTFHSIFGRIIRRNASLLGFNSDYTIYDSSDSKNLIKSIIRDLELDEKVYKPQTIAGRISMAKNAMISCEKYQIDASVRDEDKRCKRPLTYKVYGEYVRRCRLANALDFDDLLYYTNILLRDHPEVCRNYQEFFRYILVDEYQDTNFAQHMIVNQLCRESGMLCVVGDDAQSIYSFRGANISNILNLKNVYPSLQVFKLERNYRSTQNIINAAGSLIQKNVRQIPKNVFSQNGVGAPIEVVSSYSDFEESYLVANRIVQLKLSTGDTYNDFAVLYRTNAQSRILEESLRKRNIPYRIYGGLSFYQRKEVKDAVCYFRLAVNPDDDESLRRVINYPLRGIGETTVKKISKKASELGVSMWTVVNDPKAVGLDVNKGTLTKLDGFAKLVRDIHTMHVDGSRADDLATEIYERTKIEEQFLYDNAPENISRRQNLDELRNGVIEYVEKKLEEGSDVLTMSNYLAEISLATDADTDEEKANEERVTLMTIHAAKGLEFSNIMVVGVEEGLLPSDMSDGTQSEIEEERRLLYVAITRAKNHCMLSFAGSRYRNGQTMVTRPSRFLSDIDSSYVRMMNGTKLVSQNSFNHTKPRFDYKPNYVHGSTSTGISPIATASDAIYGVQRSSDLEVGMKIEHRTFGQGVIIEKKVDDSAGAAIVVKFKNVDIKTLVLKYAKIRIVEY
jgi:DNA helicase-2/ATP-dependent DNA helicase PcrA